MENFPVLTVIANGSNGIEIRAPLSENYDCVEFRLNKNPQPIFISPWMQFEPSKMSAEREQIAYEIVRRALAYETIMKKLDQLQIVNNSLFETTQKQQKTQWTTNEMWKADRAKAGLPEDFSDIKVWPPEMMSQY